MKIRDVNDSDYDEEDVRLSWLGRQLHNYYQYVYGFLMIFDSQKKKL